MICPNCGKEFTPLTVVQKYCSMKCGSTYRLRHEVEYPSITFTCAKCGRVVVTDGIRDKRTRFCSERCEKNFWRMPPWKRETSLQNFRSVQEYASWERRTNGGANDGNN